MSSYLVRDPKPPRGRHDGAPEEWRKTAEVARLRAVGAQFRNEIVTGLAPRIANSSGRSRGQFCRAVSASKARVRGQ